MTVTSLLMLYFTIMGNYLSIVKPINDDGILYLPNFQHAAIADTNGEVQFSISGKIWNIIPETGDSVLVNGIISKAFVKNLVPGEFYAFFLFNEKWEIWNTPEIGNKNKPNWKSDIQKFVSCENGELRDSYKFCQIYGSYYYLQVGCDEGNVASILLGHSSKSNTILIIVQDIKTPSNGFYVLASNKSKWILPAPPAPYNDCEVNIQVR